MYKKNVLIIILLFANLICSQNNKFSGIIKDAETLQPIEYVNITFKNNTENSTGSISNDFGEFVINTNDSEVTFSHINYETLIINLKKTNNEILLKPKTYIIDEIIISNTSPKDYLMDIIKSSKNKIDKNTLFKSYCREIVQFDNTITNYSDALVNYYIKKGNGKSKITLNQHRALKNNKILGDLDGLPSFFLLKNYVKEAYDFSELKTILRDKEYQITRKIRKEFNGKEYECIEIIPNTDSDQLLKKGYVIIDIKSKNILECKIYTSENHLKNSKLMNILIAKIKINSELFWSKFKIINDQHVLIYNKKQFGMRLKFRKKIDNDFKFTSDLFVYEFKNDVKLPSHGYNKSTIYEAGTEYTEPFWENFNAFPLSKDEIKFVDSFKTK
tara:strand:+ start:376 stop:1536 length:1161 start_codon:yes stop_codon:yes gene_type:complete